MRYDIVIHGGIVITVNPEFEIISDGLICISDGRINRVDFLHRRGNDPPSHDLHADQAPFDDTDLLWWNLSPSLIRHRLFYDGILR